MMMVYSFRKCELYNICYLNVSHVGKKPCKILATSVTCNIRYSACEAKRLCGWDRLVKSLGSDQMRYSDIDESLVWYWYADLGNNNNISSASNMHVVAQWHVGCCNLCFVPSGSWVCLRVLDTRFYGIT